MYINQSISLKRYNIKVKTIEWVGITALFLISFFNSTTLLIFIAGLLLLLYQKEVGAMKILILIIFRTILNNDLAVNISAVQSLKWLVLFACSGYLLFAFLKLTKSDRSRIKWILTLSATFALYNIFVAFAFSSLPIVATAKTISYSFIFWGVLIGMAYTKKDFDWINWLVKIFAVFMIFSIVSYPIPLSRMVNGVSFQGIIEHPNMFGIIAAMFLALVLTKLHRNPYQLFWISAIPVTMFLVVSSRSRTAFITSVGLLIMFVLFKSLKKISYLKMAILSFTSIVVVVMSPIIYKFLLKFIYKEQTVGNLLHSREEQLGTLLVNFQMNPWFGMGFSVPVLSGRYYGFSMDFIVETGNLVLAVLSFSGIVGFTIFIFFLISVLLSNKGNIISNSYLFAAPIVVSFGEMVFFSSNSVGLFCYVFLSLFIFTGTTDEKDYVKIKKRKRIVW